jgi:hypothetical protein
VRVSQVWIYPIKSCGGISLNEHRLRRTGFEFDRQWMVVDENGKFITQREHPEMAKVKLSFLDEQLQLEWGETREILRGASDEVRPVQVWSASTPAHLERNPRAIELFRDLLKKKVNLVTVGPAFGRKVRDRGSDLSAEVFFADSTPLLVTTEPSLRDLNSRMKEPVPMSRFRPNLVIEGDFAPFAEDSWKEISVAGLSIDMRRPCERCTIITIDQDKGAKASPEPLAALAKYRREGTKVLFGIRGWSEQEGLVRVGDAVQILSTKTG